MIRIPRSWDLSSGFAFIFPQSQCLGEIESSSAQPQKKMGNHCGSMRQQSDFGGCCSLESGLANSSRNKHVSAARAKIEDAEPIVPRSLPACAVKHSEERLKRRATPGLVLPTRGDSAFRDSRQIRSAQLKIYRSYMAGRLGRHWARSWYAGLCRSRDASFRRLCHPPSRPTCRKEKNRAGAAQKRGGS